MPIKNKKDMKKYHKERYMANKNNIKKKYRQNRNKLKNYALKRYYSKKKEILKYQIKRLEKIRKSKNHPKNNIYVIRHSLTPQIKKVQCDICGSKKNLNRHHWRYDKPKLINVLCKECHNIQHKKNYKIS